MLEIPLINSFFVLSIISSISEISGTANSAAADGVGALTSAAKSDKAQSISCPTAEITGSSDAAIARTTTSSENGSKSSKEPPPRPTIKTSARLNSLATFICCAIVIPASVP